LAFAVVGRDAAKRCGSHNFKTASTAIGFSQTSFNQPGHFASCILHYPLALFFDFNFTIIVIYGKIKKYVKRGK
jgi:hypothetical protein